MTPRSEAIAYRIRSWCEANGWEHTIAEIADAVGVPFGTVRRVLVLKGWMGRVRKMSADHDACAFRMRVAGGTNYGAPCNIDSDLAREIGVRI